MPPLLVTDFLTYGDPGKQLVDPTQFYQAIQLLLGFQIVYCTAATPGPMLNQATNQVNGSPLPGGLSVQAQLPVALAGLRITIFNLAPSPLNLNPSYNPGVGRLDLITGLLPMGSGTVYSCICYNPGNWYVASVATGLPVPSDPPTDEPPEEC